MSADKAENDFEEGFRALLADMDRNLAAGAGDPLQKVGSQEVLEAVTRSLMLDRFLALLGWELGLGGDVAQEARIKAETTRYMDYLGLNDATHAPVLLVEAKGWDKPFITAVGPSAASPAELIVFGLRHVRKGGDRASSPVVAVWHDHLKQVFDYVVAMKVQHDHEVPCVVLTSGQWVVVFTDPAAAFLGEADPDTRHLKAFSREELAANARDIYRALARARLAPRVPNPLRLTQLPHHIRATEVKAVYRGVRLRYEKDGGELFTPRPRVYVFAAVVIERNDGAFLVVTQPTGRLLANRGGLAAHLAEVAQDADDLLAACAQEIRVALTPADITTFPGFPLRPDEAPRAGGRKLLDDRYGVNDWLLVTGDWPHYLAVEPALACAFHTWASCGADAAGTSALAAPSVIAPRAFFVDGEGQHCAHAVQADRRYRRCHLEAVDERPCCQTCVYRSVCWPPNHGVALACGTPTTGGGRGRTLASPASCDTDGPGRREPRQGEFGRLKSPTRANHLTRVLAARLSTQGTRRSGHKDYRPGGGRARVHPIEVWVGEV